jgi:hypothetical protein
MKNNTKNYDNRNDIKHSGVFFGYILMILNEFNGIASSEVF